MPTTTENTRRVRALGWVGLKQLWARISRGETDDWGAGKAMEFLILRAFQLDRADVTWPYDVSSDGKAIEQIDGVVYCDGLAVLLESKDYSKAVNFEPIAKLRQQLTRRPPSAIGCCFARSGFTQEAILLAQRNTPQNVLLWYGDEILFSLRKRQIRKGLVAKYRHSVEHALPDFKINRQ